MIYHFYFFLLGMAFFNIDEDLLSACADQLRGRYDESSTQKESEIKTVQGNYEKDLMTEAKNKKKQEKQEKKLAKPKVKPDAKKTEISE